MDAFCTHAHAEYQMRPYSDIFIYIYEWRNGKCSFCRKCVDIECMQTRHKHAVITIWLSFIAIIIRMAKEKILSVSEEQNC